MNYFLQRSFSGPAPVFFKKLPKTSVNILLLLLVLLASKQFGYAQTPYIIGTGTGFNTFTEYPAPFGNYYWGARHQFIYRAAELTAAGLVAGPVVQFGFNVVATNNAAPHQGYTIKMKNSATNDLSLSWETGLAQVFGPVTHTPTTGWNIHTLATPFLWDGTSNIIVEVCFNNNFYIDNASTQWTQGLPTGTTRWYRADVSGVCSYVGSSQISTSRPNALFLTAPSNACAGTPNPGNTIATQSSVCSGQNVTLTTQNLSFDTGLTYQWQASTDGITWTNLPGNAIDYVATVTANTWFKVLVTCVNSGLSEASTPVLVTLNSFLTCYCSSAALYGSDEDITNVTFGSLTNASACSATGGPGSLQNRYSDYTTLVVAPVISPGQVVPVSIENSTCGISFYGSHTVIFIDYNQNGVFEVPAERTIVNNAIQTIAGTVTGFVTVPSTALPGTTRMRIITAETNSVSSIIPCGSYGYGETEDYLVQIAPQTNCNGILSAGNVPATLSVCPNNSVSITATNTSFQNGITYQWQQSTDGGTTWINVVGGLGETTPNFITPPITSTNNNIKYRLLVTCTLSGLSATSSETSILLNSFLTCYCSSGATSTNDGDIGSITFGPLNNGTATQVFNNSGANNTYSNFTATVPAPTFMQGVGYPISITQITSGSYLYNSMNLVFIDFNQDGEFTGQGELVYTGYTGGGSAANGIETTGGVITIPLSALTGTTVMRVINTESGSTFQTPCSVFSYGETEDYLINIMQAPDCAGQPEAGTLPASVFPCGSGSASLNPTGVTLATGMVYQWHQSTDGGTTWSIAPGNATEAIYSTPPFYSIAPYTMFRMVATCLYSNLSDTTNNLTIEQALAQPVALNSGPVCVGDTLQLSAVGNWPSGTTFIWSGPNGYQSSLQNPAIPNAMLTQAGTYQVLALYNGCATQAEFTYAPVVQTASMMPVWSNQPVCDGNQVTLDAGWSLGTSFTWVGPNGFTGSAAQVTISNLQPVNYGTYTVTQGSGACASIGTVAVGPPPAPQVVSNSPVCPGADILLAADTAYHNATGYSWIGPNGFTSAQTFPVIANASAADAGLYTLYVLLDGCVSPPSVVQVDVNSQINLTVANMGAINQGSALLLSASGISAGSYTWSGPNNFSAFGPSPYIQNVSPVNAGNYTVTVESPGCSAATAVINVAVNPMNQISGQVYNDFNNNGMPDAGETPKAGVLVTAQPGSYQAITNSQGIYTMYVPDSTYTISVGNLAVNQTSNPANYTGTLAGSNQVSSGNHFGIYSTVVQNLSVWISEVWTAAPGFTTYHRIGYKNNGGAVMSGTVRYKPDGLLVLNNWTTGGYTLANDTMVWTFSNLAPNQIAYKYVYLTVPAGTTLGYTLTSHAMVTPVAGDLEPANNSYSLNQVVSGSWDPNDKAVNPAGPITLQDIAGGQDLVYTIRFQNTGTDTAVNVLVMDTLSNHLDQSTFEMLSSSHGYELTLHEDGVLQWKFENIMLPDSNVNEPASHGDIQYRIKPKADLSVGDNISNTAYIYFDFNEAIITNTVVTPVGILTFPDEFDFTTLQLYPNPNTGSFTIKLSDCQPGKLQVRVLNVLGQEVYAEAVSTNNTALEHQLQLHELPEGLYLVQVQQGELVKTARLILQK